MPTKVIMPKLGESVVEGTVTAWLKEEGQKIEEFESLLEVNTDKVDTEVPSSASGTLLKILIPEGETVEAGTILAWIGETGEEIPEKGQVPAEAEEPEVEPDSETSPIEGEPPAERPAGRDEELGYISPVVARIAQKENVDLSKVKGTGMEERITKKDILNYIQGQQEGKAEEEIPIWETPADGDLFRPTEMMFPKGEAKASQAPKSKPAAIPGETLPLSPLRKQIAEHMVYSKRTAPHVTTVMEADMSRVATHRKESQPKAKSWDIHLTYSAYFLSAIIAGLKAVPLANSTWTEKGIYIHQHINLGMAVALPSGGLIVPVIKNADELSLIGIARQVNDLAKRARGGELKPDEVQGGTFTLTNHGTKGSLFATPVINQPQSGILGTGIIQKRVVAVNDAIAIRPMVYLSYTFDHRILDGASADTFLTHVVHTLENWPNP